MSNEEIILNNTRGMNSQISGQTIRRRIVTAYEETLIVPTSSRLLNKNKNYSRVSTFSMDIWKSVPKKIEIYGEHFNYRYFRIFIF